MDAYRGIRFGLTGITALVLVSLMDSAVLRSFLPALWVEALAAVVLGIALVLLVLSKVYEPGNAFGFTLMAWAVVGGSQKVSAALVGFGLAKAVERFGAVLMWAPAVALVLGPLLDLMVWAGRKRRGLPTVEANTSDGSKLDS